MNLKNVEKKEQPKIIQQFQIQITQPLINNKPVKQKITRQHRKITVLVIIIFYFLYYFIHGKYINPKNLNNLNKAIINTEKTLVQEFKDENQGCIYDWTHQITTSFNIKINQDEQFRYWSMIIAQQIIDIYLIVLILTQLLKSQNFYIPSWFGLFYGIRGVFLNVERFPFPEGHYWQEPGFPPSLSVPYGKTRDFFYSGHSGFLVFCWLFHSMIKNPSKLQLFLKYFAFIGLIMVMFVLTITRVHYIIDIVAAWIVSLYLLSIVFKNLYYFDLLWSTIIYFIKNIIEYGWAKIKIACNLDQ